VAEDYRGGRDFSGVTFREFGDSDLAACFWEDIPIMLDSCSPMLAIHHQIPRQPETEETAERRFLRYIVKISAHDGNSTLISVWRRQNPRVGLGILDTIIDRQFTWPAAVLITD
jgi:hypothetical protein